MKRIALIASVALVFAACKSRSRDVTLSQPINLNGQMTSTQSTAGKSPAQLPVGNSTAGLKTNPEHGQPGHRCELAVGAPLPGTSSASLPVATTAQPAPQVTTSQPVVATPINLPASNTTTSASKNTAGLNPAHGQPGHRCEIAVGAPLTSAPAVKTNNSVQNVTVQPVNNPTPTAPGMNPQHGQPGHRCDIAVGAPLNSAPAKVEAKADSTAKN